MLSGFLLVNKPIGASSYACIGRIKFLLRQDLSTPKKIKIGHAGTLDPFASGLLIIAIDREATRLLSQCMAMKKTYVATGKCGELTDTLDCTGTIIKTTDIIPTEGDLREALKSFCSSYEQTPPIYSALKHEGSPLYALARKNKLDEEQLHAIAQAKSRTVQLYDKQFLSYNAPYFSIQVTVSQGTYIRTLINDIAIRAGSCATTYELTRTAIGPFTLDKTLDVFQINTIADLETYIIPADLFFKDA